MLQDAASAGNVSTNAAIMLMVSPNLFVAFQGREHLCLLMDLPDMKVDL